MRVIMEEQSLMVLFRELGIDSGREIDQVK
jgi:hypothetical protein